MNDVRWTVERQNGEVLLKLTGKINVKVANAFKPKLHEMIDVGERSFKVDMSKADYMDSTGLGALVEIRNRLIEMNGSLKIKKDLNPVCFEIFRTCNLVKDFIEM